MSSPYDPNGMPGGYTPQGFPPPQQGYGYPPQQGFPPQQRGYLQGGPVNFQNAVKLQFANVTNFNGRASRSAYWWYALALFIVGAVFDVLSVAIGSAGLSLLIFLLLTATGLSGLSAAVRRLHDTDKSGFLLLLVLIPFVGSIAVIVLLALPGTPGPNRFG